MAGKHVLFYHLLRILTPDELNELTTTSKGRNLVSLTKMLSQDIDEEKNLDDEGAKILPFKVEVESDPQGLDKSVDEAAFQIVCGENCKTILDDHVKRITILDKQYSRNCPVSQEATTFIINEKTRFKDNYNKIKSKEVLSLYKKNASFDMEREKVNNEDMSKSANLGVLVNKKQA